MLIDLGAVKIDVRERGAGRAVMFGHSLGFDGEMWDAQLDAIGARRRAIAIDFRGHGRTESTGAFTLDDLADDVARLLDALAIDRVAYCGLSLGGMVGMRLALRHPSRVTALALLNTSAEPEENRALFETYNEAARGKPADPGGAALLVSLQFSRAFLDEHPDVAARYRERAMRIDRGDQRYFAAREVLARADTLASLRAIAAPTLVVGSTGDVAIPIAHARAIAAAIPNARMVELDGGHLSAVEHADEVTRAILELLERTES